MQIIIFIINDDNKFAQKIRCQFIIEYKRNICIIIAVVCISLDNDIQSRNHCQFVSKLAYCV